MYIVYLTVLLETILISCNRYAAHKDLRGRFGLGTTEFFSRHVWHWSWESHEDLVNCIHGSMSFPLYCEELRFVNGSVVLDGAYSFAGTDLPEGDNTLFIGIDPNAEITRTFTNRQMLFPLVGEEYRDIAQTGYDAMMKWDGVMKKKVGVRFPNYQALSILWVVRVIELVLLFLYNMLVVWPLPFLSRFFLSLISEGNVMRHGEDCTPLVPAS